MNNFCNSCGMPLAGENGKDYRGNYCIYCTDENGKLLPRELIQRGVAEWLKQIADGKDGDYNKKAGYYMKAMPAWSEEE